ncbi:uncharacterized protein CXorf65 homolog [Clarias gariepinus]|uniref:uncharacterized protein CXorf65 homolog n=1 Tax=Clarias gariepinus TaxID=13013 RepID=UPI00234DAE57|nr:uncharacterized protein CXorf65 homolog [Clarias gariepinus]
MFAYIKHDENEDFLVNTSCSIICLLQYLRFKLGLPQSELVDLCDEMGTLLFMFRHLQDYASQILTPRNTYIVCTINRGSDGTYVSITPHKENPDVLLQAVLQNQLVSLEQTRRKNRHFVARRKTSVRIVAQKQPVRPRNPTNR